jgi:hypothetical protein
MNDYFLLNVCELQCSTTDIYKLIIIIYIQFNDTILYVMSTSVEFGYTL